MLGQPLRSQVKEHLFKVAFNLSCTRSGEGIQYLKRLFLAILAKIQTQVSGTPIAGNKYRLSHGARFYLHQR